MTPPGLGEGLAILSLFVFFVIPSTLVVNLLISGFTAKFCGIKSFPSRFGIAILGAVLGTLIP